MSLALPAARLPLPRLSKVPNGTVVGLGFALLANAACLAGVAGVVGVAFPAGALVVSALLARVQPLAALEFALWLWLLGPQVRRMVDLSTGYHDPSVVLLAAPLASLALVTSIGHLRRPAPRRAVRPLMTAMAAVALAYAVGAARSGLQPATAALLLWAVPLLFGLQVVAVRAGTAELHAMVERFLVVGVLVVGIYGVVQFFAIPAWDAFWMLHTPMRSIGTPEPTAVRVFSTLNSPGPLGVFLAAALLQMTGMRHRLLLPAQVAGYLTLALSLVRSAWIGWALGIVVVLVAGRQRARTTALVAVALIAVGVLQVGGPVQQAVAERFDETREGRQDDSFVARVALHHEMLPLLAADVVGSGLGATGTASTLVTNGAPRLPVLDSGFIDFGYSLGLPGGLLALGALAVGGLQLSRTGLRRGVVPAGTVAAGLSVLVQLLFGNSLSGVGGIVFFLLWAVALRDVLEHDTRARQEAL